MYLTICFSILGLNDFFLLFYLDDLHETNTGITDDFNVVRITV